MTNITKTNSLSNIFDQFDAAQNEMANTLAAIEARALSLRTRPYPDLYKTEVVVTRGKTESFSHSMMALNIHNPRTEMDTIVDRDALKLARFLSKWTGLKTRVLDYRVDMGAKDGWRLHSGVVIGFRQDTKSIFKNGLMGNEGIHKAVHQALANPEFWKELNTKYDFIRKIGAIKVDGIAYSYNRDGQKFLKFELDPNWIKGKRRPDSAGTSFYNKDGKVEMVIDISAVETNNNPALACSLKRLSEPGRPTPVLEISGPSRNVK